MLLCFYEKITETSAHFLQLIQICTLGRVSHSNDSSLIKIKDYRNGFKDIYKTGGTFNTSSDRVIDLSINEIYNGTLQIDEKYLPCDINKLKGVS